MPWGVAVTVCGLVIRIRGAKPGSAISLRCVRCFTCDDGPFHCLDSACGAYTVS